MSADPKEILHHTMDGGEPLQMSGRLEAAHLALALAGRLVRDLGAIVRVLLSDVNDRRHHGPVGRRVMWWADEAAARLLPSIER